MQKTRVNRAHSAAMSFALLRHKYVNTFMSLQRGSCSPPTPGPPVTTSTYARMNPYRINESGLIFQPTWPPPSHSSPTKWMFFIHAILYWKKRNCPRHHDPVKGLYSYTHSPPTTMAAIPLRSASTTTTTIRSPSACGVKNYQQQSLYSVTWGKSREKYEAMGLSL